MQSLLACVHLESVLTFSLSCLHPFSLFPHPQEAKEKADEIATKTEQEFMADKLLIETSRTSVTQARNKQLICVIVEECTSKRAMHPCACDGLRRVHY